jgi:hypothetical protein
MRFRGTWRGIAAACVVLSVVSCNRPVIRGTVINPEGERLPGVAVNSVGADYSDLTNALGEFEIRFRPGTVVLEFAKTGYTPARLEINASAAPMQQSVVEMWRLPNFSGVYLMENFRYREAPGLELKTYYTENDQPIAGTQREIALSTEASEPLIVTFGMPRYDARLHRLRQMDAYVAEGEQVLQTIWVAAESLPVDVVPVDQPEGVLLQLRLDAPLEPGEYAVHWGAFEGYTTLDTRIFPFRVVVPADKAAEAALAAAEDAISPEDGDAEPDDTDEPE